jgi:hypothetical protein
MNNKSTDLGHSDDPVFAARRGNTFFQVWEKIFSGEAEKQLPKVV